MSFKKALAEKQDLVEKLLHKYLPNSDSPNNEIIVKAMAYSLFAGGKRLRPILMNETYRACGGHDDIIYPFMAAIEMIHTYSLIHDDLPAMDNDDLRRGKPTCHIVFGEDIAILAGDALLNRAFEIVIDEAIKHNNINVLKSIKVLADASGSNGMIGGQVADMANENKPMDLEILNYIHMHKTSALIEGAFVIGALLAGAGDDMVKRFRVIGQDIGLAFQIQDDLLDIYGNEETLGKPIKSDEKNNKMTYVTLFGMDKSRSIIEEKLEHALCELKLINQNNYLNDFILYLKTRKN